MKLIPNVGELNAFTLTTTLYAPDGSAALPVTLEWRMTCPDTDKEISPWTTATYVTSVGADGYTSITTAEIEVSALLHEMQTTKDRERRAINVSTDRNTAVEVNDDFVYYVEKRFARS